MVLPLVILDIGKKTVDHLQLSHNMLNIFRSVFQLVAKSFDLDNAAGYLGCECANADTAREKSKDLRHRADMSNDSGLYVTRTERSR